MDRSLFKLTQDFSALDSLLAENGGEVSETLQEWMSINEENMKEKTDNYYLYMEHLQARVDYFKSMAKKFQEAAKLFENHKERLKENLHAAMGTLSVNELVGNDFKFKKVIGAPKLVIDDENSIPLPLMQETIVREPKKEEIKAILKSGESVPGAYLMDTVQLRSYVATENKKLTKGEK